MSLVEARRGFSELETVRRLAALKRQQGRSLRHMKIYIPRLEPSEEGEGIDTVVSPVVGYDETLLGAEYSVIAIDPNRSYDEAEKEGHNG